MSLSILSFVVVAASLLSRLAEVSAQVTAPVQCSPNYAWAFNSLQQSPCLVAAYLQGACNGGEFSIDALPANSHYVGPTLLAANPCQCSSVVYSMISACADCQNRTYIGWRDWNTNCSTPYLRLFPVDIPTQTAVPAWAYLDVGTSDLYNPTLAKSDINAPESSARGSGTSTARGTATGTSKPESKSSGTNVGAIAGGVVGGVVVLGALIALAIFFILKRRRARTAPSAAYGSVFNASAYPSPPPTTKEYSYNATPFTAMSPDVTTPGGVPKLYDPADPSTFPTSPASATLHTTDSSPYHDSNYGSYHTPPPPRGAYSGAPEI